jgi:hypothetical protein
MVRDEEDFGDEYSVDPFYPHNRNRISDPESKRSILHISLMLGAATFIVIGFAISLWLRPILNRRDPDIGKAPLKTNITSQFKSPSRDQALEMVKRALYVNNAQGVISSFHLGKMDPGEVLYYLATLEKRDGSIQRFDWLSCMDKDGLLIEGVLVVLKGKEKPVGRLALLTPDRGGSWKIDFEAFARPMEPSWESLLEKREEHAVVRVIVCPDIYFNGHFRDESKWLCYGMVSPDLDTVLRGYCEIGSPEAGKLDQLFRDGTKSSRVTLEIQVVKEAESRQFQITKVLAFDWIVAEGANQAD